MGTRRGFRIYRWLTEPLSAVADSCDRRRARLVAGMLLLLLLLGYGIASGRLFLGSQRRVTHSDLLVLGFLTLLWFPTYYWSRYGQADRAAQVMVIGSSAGIIAFAVLDGCPEDFVYLLLPLIFSSIVLTVAFTAVLTVVDVFAVLVVTVAASNLTPGGVWDFELPILIAGGILLVGINLYRVQLEHDRQAIWQESAAQMRTVLERMPVMLMALDDEGRVVLWNRECERVTGYTADEVIGDLASAEHIFAPADTHLRDISNESRNFRDLERAIVCKDGQTKIIAWSSIAGETPIKGWAAWSVGVDISGRQQAENHRLRLEIERQRVDLLRRFLDSASHDLRTPITTLKTSLYIMKRTTDPSRLSYHLGLAEQQVEHLTLLLDKMLEALRVDIHGENAENTLQELNLSELTEHVVSLSMMRARQKRLALTLDASKTPLPVLGDAQNLTIAIGNVIENALNFSRPGSVVEVRVYGDGSNGVVEIADHGPGIDAAILPHIFEHFFRGDYARRTNTGGAGLGLTITRNVAAAHGGTVTVQSVVEQGSTFRIMLPLLELPGDERS